jgi:hypothetical protein
MAEWKYLPEERWIAEGVSGTGVGRIVAQEVSPEDGPRLALAPRMEAAIRSLYRSGGRLAPCDCDLCVEGRALLREIDVAREDSDAQD